MKQAAFIVIFALLILLATAGTLSAHEIYIGLEEVIDIDTETEIRLYWGHFPDTPDPESTYYSQLTEGTFYIIEPDGTEIILQPEVFNDYYIVRFTPRQAGDHWAVFRHNRGVIDYTHGEPAGNQLSYVYAKALLDVHGNNETLAFSRIAGHDLEILPLVDGGHLHTGETYMAQLLYSGQPLVGVTVMYSGPNDTTGDTTTGDGGTFTIPLSAEGDWLIKIAYFDQDRAGEYEGTAILGVRYATTLLVTPHSHDDEEITATPSVPKPKNPSNLGYITLILLFILGAGYFYKKSTQ